MVVWRWRGAQCCHGDRTDWQGRLIKEEELETGGRRRATKLQGDRLGQSEHFACRGVEGSRVLGVGVGVALWLALVKDDQ